MCSLLCQGRVSAAAPSPGSHGAFRHCSDWIYLGAEPAGSQWQEEPHCLDPAPLPVESRASKVSLGNGNNIARAQMALLWWAAEPGLNNTVHPPPPACTWLALLPAGTGARSEQQRWHSSLPCMDPAVSSSVGNRAGQSKQRREAQHARCLLGCLRTWAEKLQRVTTS